MDPQGGELFPGAFAPAGDPSPVMAQYLRAKARAGAALLFFRLGDFYELFYEDAKTAARLLGLTLTSRSRERGESGEPIPMAGVPVRSVHSYLRRLVQAGHSVALCEQLQDPKQARGLIDRDVVRLVTAGTLTEDELLDGSRSNYLTAVHFEEDRAGLSWCDLSTGAFVACEVPRRALGDELARLAPAEVLIADSSAGTPAEREIEAATPAARTQRSDASFHLTSARRRLCEAFGVATLEGFGLDDRSLGVAAAGAILDYLRDTQRAALAHIRRIEPHEPTEFVVLDRATREALELTETLRAGTRDATLVAQIDRTRTAMGGRKLREWLLAPLRSIEAIHARQAAVAEFVESPPLRAAVRAALDPVADLERILGRLGCDRGSPADLGHLRRSLEQIPVVRRALEEHTKSRANWTGPVAVFDRLLVDLDPNTDVLELLSTALVESPPLVANEGGIVKDGTNAELDELRLLSHDGKGWLARLEEREIARTGIPNLKVGFHRVHGYFLEVTNVHAARVPADYARIQTLKDRERYSTAELREFEARVRSAETRAIELERAIFESLRRQVASRAPRLLASARALAELDAIAAFSEAAVDHHYVRPEVDDSLDLKIEQGRHPVVEQFSNEPFVPNDTELSAGRRVMVLTGPNMAGKSTYLRQVALIVLLAQAGSFVPARSAKIGVVDRISTRLGSSDDLARGRSTFLVEMVETAAIMNHASERSLVVLDEVGRGTSTFDGMAIAWAVAEHLAESVRARTLFATHYHELNELANHCGAVVNYRVDVKEWGDRVVFLRQVVPGGTDRSFGLHVARLAGIAPSVLARARDVLRALESEAAALGPRIARSVKTTTAVGNTRPSLLDSEDERCVLDELRAVNPDRLTPLEALLLLGRLRERLGPPTTAPGRDRTVD